MKRISLTWPPLICLLVSWPETGQSQCELRWREQTFIPSPIARQRHGMVYDSARGRVVVFGGADVLTLSGTNDVYGDTWEFNGFSWEQRLPPNVPPARHGHAMTYDAARGVTVLFSGEQENVIDNDVWEWNGSDWTRVPVSGPAPRARKSHGMAYDPARRVHVMFGGFGHTDTGPSYLGDTWEYNGATRTWTLRNETGPSPRSRIQLAFESARNRTLLFGGQTPNGQDLGDTWSWDGTAGSWTQLAPANSPSARYFYSLAYDNQRAVTILCCGAQRFGATSIATIGDTWEWDGTNWRDKDADYFFCCPRASGGMAYDSFLGQMVFFGGDGAHDTNTWILQVPPLFVDWRNSGPQDGSASRPFRTVRQAVEAPASCSIIHIQTGDYAEAPFSISRPVRMQALNGPVTIR